MYYVDNMKRTRSAVIVALMLLFPISSFAQEGDLRLVTSPLPINLSAKPGSEVSTQIRIKNDGSMKERLEISLLKFAAFGENGAPRILDPEPGDEYISWVSFIEPEFDIEPGEWKTVPMNIALPESASFGYYYAVVFSRAGAVSEPEAGQTAIAGGTAVLVLLEAEVPGAKREVRTVSFSTDRTIYEFLPATFTVRVENIGNVHLSPRGNVFVGRAGSQDADILEINPEKGNILPKSFREFSTIWSDGFPAYDTVIEDGKVMRDEDGTIRKRLLWSGGDISRIRIGKYQAKLIMIYDDGQRDVPLEGVVEFWVIPWRILLGSFVIVLLVLVGVRSTLTGLFGRIKKKRK